MKTITPLSIISIFFTSTELYLGYAVLNTSGLIQIWLTIYVIFFPIFISIIFFIFLWKRPTVFYSPYDFREDASYLKTQELNKSSNIMPINTSEIQKIEEDISKNNTPNDDIRKSVLKKLIDGSFLMIDYSKILPADSENTTQAFIINDQTEFKDLTNNVYFRIKNTGVEPYTYGLTWILQNSETKEIYKNERMIKKILPGNIYTDRRLLKDIGIKPGNKLQVIPLS